MERPLDAGEPRRHVLEDPCDLPRIRHARRVREPDRAPMPTSFATPRSSCRPASDAAVEERALAYELACRLVAASNGIPVGALSERQG